MDYSELRALFKGILNRNDCTDTLADMFIGMGLSRIERNLRTQFQTETFTYAVPASYAPIVLPTDVIALRVVSADGTTLRRATETDFDEDDTGTPECFIVKMGNLHVSPVPAEGTTITVYYYGKMTRTVSGVSVYSDNFPDLVAYAALIYACDWFMDARKGDFESFYGMLGAEVQAAADDYEWSGSSMQITNPYAGYV